MQDTEGESGLHNVWKIQAIKQRKLTMSSLTSPGLVKAMNDALVKASPDLNIARLFAFDMSDEFADYGYTVKVPLVGAGTISSFNMASNDYENVDGTVTYATVQLDSQPKSTFEF